ncbi:aspartate aminotransferase family protein [Leptolyngbya sp. DQ-M1]|uniref:pyridoxal phosphate-dependent decarboxylase family protein n=1 Tax=Leptolyngbya sp. DQ-M1 TaxID=2933920 RepID=UPI003296BA6A
MINAQSTQFDAHFLTNSTKSLVAYHQAIVTAQEVLLHYFANQTQAYSGASPEEIASTLATVDFFPMFGRELSQVLNDVGKTVVSHSVNVSHSHCMAHLHCPPLIPALTSELLINAMNQSMDSWDQSPAATLLEQQMVNELCRLFGYGAGADGIFTSGGTQSNFMGLLLARDRYASQHLNWQIQQQGLPPEANRFRILCSDVSHFTIRQAAALLGLGEKSVIQIETDAEYRLCPIALERQLQQLQAEKLLPIAIVATAGTTDFGSIDPLLELAACAKRYGLWFHVDAAFGGALVLSDRHRHKLAGIELADSITVDFHKLFYQPISCGAFLLKDRSHFNFIKLHADYLNPETNAVEGIPDLVTKSVQTTRRFDALKLFVSLQALGRQQFAEMIDTTLELATATAQLISTDPALELANHPAINAVVFRYYPQQNVSDQKSEGWHNRINSQIRAMLLQSGEAVIAQTKIRDRVYLKFTLLNPRTTLADIRKILDSIKQLGQVLERI